MRKRMMDGLVVPVTLIFIVMMCVIGALAFDIITTEIEMNENEDKYGIKGTHGEIACWRSCDKKEYYYEDGGFSSPYC